MLEQPLTTSDTPPLPADPLDDPRIDVIAAAIMKALPKPEDGDVNPILTLFALGVVVGALLSTIESEELQNRGREHFDVAVEDGIIGGLEARAEVASEVD